MIIFFRMIFCVVLGWIVFDFLAEMYKAKYNNKYIYCIGRLVYIVLYMSIDLWNKPLVNLVYGFISISIVSIILFEIKSLKGIIYNTLFMMGLLSIDIITVCIVSIFKDYTIITSLNHEQIMLFTCIINQILDIATYKYMISLLRKSKIDRISISKSVYFILMLIFQLSIIIYLSYYGITSSGGMLIYIVIVFTILDLYTVFILYQVSKYSEIKYDILFYQKQNAMTHKYYSNMKKKYNESRKLLHDIRNHIVVLEHLYETNQKEVAKNYTLNLYKEMESLGYNYKCNNSILNVIIDEKIRRCKESNIVFNIRIQDTKMDFIESIDLTKIFGNLLDNAIEANLQIEEGKRYIELRIHEFNNYVVINITNSMNQVIWTNDNIFLSTKKDHLGIGLKNIEESVKKYEGNLKIDYSMNEFQVKIVLLIPQKE
ncbi:sensor histidine kinase [Cellulosilyticum ruminicola]|uniref:sensor histidine kinase n=1 Tax=Cellulosilyticum ruminicola TaxID=425254 RepID=UPI0006D09400|nr:sensor histidine kinase [Cellulosilyticum ruminicola]